MVDVKPRIAEEINDKSKIWKLSEITDPSQCRSLKLPEHLRVSTKVCFFTTRLKYVCVCARVSYIGIYICLCMYVYIYSDTSKG